MKNSEIVSEIINDLRSLNLDDHISKRYVLAKLQDNAALFIKRENELLRLYNYQDIWTTVSCIEMEPADVVECCCIRIEKCKFMMKSTLPLPDIYSYKGGPLIQEVLSMDGSQEYRLTTPRGYKRILDREFIDKNVKYFWIENDHIIIPDSRVKLVSLTAFFRNVSEAKQLNSCDDSGDNNCIRPLDEEFLCPAHLLSIVKESTITNLFNFYKRNQIDTLPDDDNNKKVGQPD